MSKQQESRREFWRQLVAQQQQSGVSVRAFCQQRGTSEHSFYQWRKRLAANLPVKFALVETHGAAPANGSALELILVSDERLRITPGFDIATLRAVLSVLREPR
jgi:transposase-like protein